tara:strand:- start:322 stop:624 length:303 start_codon:yes stop_codon:yes gene_type:complete
MTRSAWMRTDDQFGPVTPCAVPFCMETIGKKDDGSHIWICGRHWLHIGKRVRKAFNRPGGCLQWVLDRAILEAIDGSHIDYRIRAGSEADVRRLQELCHG